MLQRLLILLLIGIVPGCFDSAEKTYSDQVTEMVEDAGGRVELAEGHEENYSNLPPYAIIGIYFRHADLSGFDLGALYPLNHLEYIGLEATDFHDLQISYLLNCPSLRQIDLHWTEVTDKGVEQLRELPELESLGLIGCNVTDECMDDLLAMESLMDVHLYDTHVTAEGVKRLRDRGIDVFWKGTVPNEEARRAISALNRRNMVAMSSFRPEEEEGPSFRFQIMVIDESQIDPGVSSDLQALDQFAPLDISSPPNQLLPLLNDLSRIDDLYIRSYEHEHRDPAVVIEHLSKCQPQSFRVLSLCLDPLPPGLLARWIQTEDLEILYLERQEINSQVWQAIVEAPTLKKIQFDDCQFQQVDKFPPTERPIAVKIYDEDYRSDEEPSYAATVLRLLNAGKEPPDEDPPSEL